MEEPLPGQGALEGTVGACGLGLASPSPVGPWAKVTAPSCEKSYQRSCPRRLRKALLAFLKVVFWGPAVLQFL